MGALGRLADDNWVSMAAMTFSNVSRSAPGSSVSGADDAGGGAGVIIEVEAGFVADPVAA